MMPKTLMLHIGHHKTGSSYLQSVIAANIPKLEGEGICYPAPRMVDLIAKGKTSNGNLVEFKDKLFGAGQLECESCDTHLFSSEDFFGQLSEADFKARFRTLLSKGKYNEIKILLFIRDPVSQAISAYQQRIKGGSTQVVSIEDSLKADDFPKRVIDVLTFLDEFDNVKVTVKNYSRVRLTLLDEFCSWLGISKDLLELPPLSTVNRSMTASELMLLSNLANKEGDPASILTDALCYELPNQPADEIRPSLEDQVNLWERHRVHIERINARVDDVDRYDQTRDVKPPKTGVENAEFNPDQVRVIALSYASLVARLVGQQKMLVLADEKLVQMSGRNQDLKSRLAESQERNQILSAKIEALNGVIAKLRANQS